MHNHDVRIIALHSNFSGLHEKDFFMDGVQVIYVGQMHVRKVDSKKVYFSLINLLWNTIWSTLALCWAVLKFPADISHICKPHPMNSLAGLLAKMTGRSRKVFLDCDDYEAASNRFTTPWQYSVIHWFEQNIPRAVNAITTNTRFMQEKLTANGVVQKPLLYLPNGVDVENFVGLDLADIEKLRRTLGLQESTVVLYIGSLSTASHPVDILIEAQRRVFRLRPNVKLLIVGGGEDLDRLRNLSITLGLQDSVVFTGKVPQSKVPLYYHLASISVDPVYDNEAARGRCPLKLFESWASGTPFISGDVGDRKQLIGDPPAGYLIKPGDPDALADGLLFLLNNPNICDAFSERGKMRVVDFAWQKLALQLETFYISVIKD